jgi:hypothetical protein
MILDRYGQPYPTTPEPRQARATHYDLADTNRENREQWRDADSWDADKCNDPQTRQLSRNRSRLETDNNPSLKGNIKTLVNYELGRGSTLHVDHDNQDYARDVEENYGLWREATNHVGKFWTMLYARTQDGESFARIGRNPNLRHPEDIDRPFPVQLDWQPFECDRCYTYWLPPYTPGRVDGVWFDDWGNETYFDILRYHPGGVFPLGVIQYDTIPAQYICHLYFPERPGQHRGVPEFASSIGFLGIRRRYTLATVEAAETAAKIGVYLKTNSPPSMEPDEAGPPMAMRIPRGSAWPLPQGWDIAQPKAEQPTQTYESFSEVSLNEAMRPKSIPRNVALCDSSNYNMASGRLDITTLWESVGIDQRNNTWRLENPLFRAWYTEARQVYRTGGKRWSEIDGGTIPKRVFMWQRERYSDPEVQQGADERAVSTGFRGIQDIYADRGEDWARKQVINAKNLGFKDEPGGMTAVDQYLEWTRGNLTISKGGAPDSAGQQAGKAGYPGTGSGEKGGKGEEPVPPGQSQPGTVTPPPAEPEPKEDTPAQVKAKFRRMFPGLAARLNGHLAPRRKAKAAGTLKAYLWPGVRQETNFECGAASVKFVLDGFGCNPDEKDLQTIADELGTTAAESTSPQAIVSYLSAAGLAVCDRQNMSVDDLIDAAGDNQVVICCCQDYVSQGEPASDKAQWNYGHWVTFLDVYGEAPHRVLFFHDSSMGNMEREPGGDVPAAEADDERVLEMPGIRTILERDWIAAWHDEAVEGTLYDHYGISVGLPERSTPTAQLAQEAISE